MIAFCAKFDHQTFYNTDKHYFITCTVTLKFKSDNE